MVHCVAWGCQIKSKEGLGIHFFCFPPKSDDRRNAWMHHCQCCERGWKRSIKARLFWSFFFKCIRSGSRQTRKVWIGKYQSIHQVWCPAKFIYKKTFAMRTKFPINEDNSRLIQHYFIIYNAWIKLGCLNHDMYMHETIGSPEWYCIWFGYNLQCQFT